MKKKLTGKWKFKKTGGWKWVWKKRKVKKLKYLQPPKVSASGVDSDHTTAPTTDGDAHRAE